MQGALSMGCFHTGILLFQPTFLTAPWFGWRVHCQLCDPLRNTVYRSVVVASGFGMFNRSFHWVPQMNLFWNILDRGKKDKLEPCWDNEKSHWYCTTPWIFHLNQKHVTIPKSAGLPQTRTHGEYMFLPGLCPSRVFSRFAYWQVGPPIMRSSQVLSSGLRPPLPFRPCWWALHISRVKFSLESSRRWDEGGSI